MIQFSSPNEYELCSKRTFLMSSSLSIKPVIETENFSLLLLTKIGSWHHEVFEDLLRNFERGHNVGMRGDGWPCRAIGRHLQRCQQQRYTHLSTK
ncbi:hypothetical protein TNCV_4340991 [Trichonephila clavipes]|nr:hypothetical protein TNCV_4340991 [Trichonephila clavipes]